MIDKAKGYLKNLSGSLYIVETNPICKHNKAFAKPPDMDAAQDAAAQRANTYHAGKTHSRAPEK